MKSNTKHTLFLAFLIASLTVLMFIKTMKLEFVKNQKARGCDVKGCGEFGAARGDKKHQGFDILVNPSDEILAPFPLEIKRFGVPYADSMNLTLVEFQGLGIFSVFTVKVMYMDSPLAVGTKLKKGDHLGTAQNVAEYHGGGMKNHIHVEFRCLGKLVNPEPFLKLS